MTTGTGPIGPANPASAERTRLAWRRTDLAATIVVLLIARLAVHDRLTALSTTGLTVSVLVWIALLWLTQRRIRSMAEARPRVVGRTLPAVAFLIAGLTLIGIALATFGPTG